MQCCPHIETGQLICTGNQLSGFYMRAKVALNGLTKEYFLMVVSTITIYDIESHFETEKRTLITTFEGLNISVKNRTLYCCCGFTVVIRTSYCSCCMWGWVEAIKNENCNREVLWEIFKCIVGNIQRLVRNMQKYRGKYKEILCKIWIIIRYRRYLLL